MIVPMRKVTVLCLAAHRDETLDALRQFGALHVQPVRMELEEDVEKARREYDAVRRAMEILPHRPHTPPSGIETAEIVRSLLGLIRERRDLENDLADLRHEEKRVLPMGDFDPKGIEEMARHGLSVRIFQTDIRQPPPTLENAVVRDLFQDKSVRVFAVIAQGVPEAPGLELRLPTQSLSGIRNKILEMEKQIQGIETRVAALGGDYPAVAALRTEHEDRVRFLEVRSGMENVGAVSYVRGYCPERRVGEVRAAAKRSGWGLLAENPGEEDPAPTLLEHPAWVRPIQTVFDFMGILPGYREADISAVFLLFLSLFFAMLVGDAGYGAVFLGLTLWARKKIPSAPPHAIRFLSIMSGCAILWGLLTGSFFGIETLPSALRRIRVEWLTRSDHVMGLCFLIGAAHLTVAHLWNGWRKRREWKALAQLGWIGITWGMFLAARHMVLNEPFPRYGAGLLGGGVLLVLLFMTPVSQWKREWLHHAMFPLSLVSAFVDIVSYIRLFAVGIATLAVAQAFNQMAIGDGIRGIPHGLLAALTLFLGHSLNLALAAMGVVVHGVRLNTLEFSGHMEMQWTGIPYRPFVRGSRTPAETGASS